MDPILLTSGTGGEGADPYRRLGDFDRAPGAGLY